MLSIRNYPIFRKVMLVLGAFAALTLGAAGFAANTMRTIETSYANLIAQEGNVALYLSRSSRAFQSARAAIAELTIAGTTAGKLTAVADMKAARDNLNEFMAMAESAATANAPVLKLLQDRATRALDVGCSETLQFAQQAEETNSEAQRIFLRDCTPQFGPISREFYLETQKAVDAEVALGKSLADRVQLGIMTTFALIAVGLAVLIMAAYVVVRRWISGPLAELNGTMNSLARGDLSAKVPDTTRRDEVGAMSRTVQIFKDAAIEKRRLEEATEDQRQTIEAERSRTELERQTISDQLAVVVESLAGALHRLSAGDLTCDMTEPFAPEYDRIRTDFNAAVHELRHVIGMIVANTGAIRSGTGEISQAADDLSRRTEQQAASLEETAAALDEITTTVRKTADGAHAAQGVAAAAKLEAERGEGVVREAVTAMSEIEKSAKEISQIIGVIDEIAFQTNLLALNAGVEAARAGDAGRGFAVVASEVRALAQRSAEAAKEIKGLIGTSTSHVSRGVTLVRDTGTALGRILGQVTQINGAVTDIAASAHEQASGLAEVNTAVNQMDQVTQQNAAMVEQSTAASHSLANDTAELEQLTARFKTGGERAPKPDLADTAPRTPPRPAAAKGIRVVAGNLARKPRPDRDAWQEF